MFKEFSLKETLTAFMVLFAVIDILGSAPIIVSLRKKFGHINSEKASLASVILMISFLFLGETILSFIGIDVNSFAIAGSFVIFIIAIEMILGIEINKPGEVKSASIVPVAFPLLAGAGTLTTILSLRAQYQLINIMLAIILNVVVVYIVLKSAVWIEKKIGDLTLTVFKKVFGIILLAISIKLFTTNFVQLISDYIHLLKTGT